MTMMRQFETQRSGYDNGGSGMQERMARLETRAETIGDDLKDIKQDIRTLKVDYRQLLWAGISASALLFGTLAASHLMLQSRIDVLAEKLSDIQASVAAIAARLPPAAG